MRTILREPLVVGLLSIILVLLVFQIYLTVRVANRPTSYGLPRVIDENGRDLLYVCPQDARCQATVTPRP